MFTFLAMCAASNSSLPIDGQCSLLKRVVPRRRFLEIDGLLLGDLVHGQILVLRKEALLVATSARRL